MKRVVLSTTFVAVALYAVLDSGVSSALILFFMVGSVPGTDIVVSAEYMAGIYTAIVGVLIARLITTIAKRIARIFKRRTKKPSLPRRRYARVQSAQ